MQAQIEAGEIDPSTVIVPYPERIFETAMTGDVIDTAQVFARTIWGSRRLTFTTTSAGAQEFQEPLPAPTSTSGWRLCWMATCSPIRTINGIISAEGVKLPASSRRKRPIRLAVQLRYGSLPVPLERGGGAHDWRQPGPGIGAQQPRRGHPRHDRRAALHAADLPPARPAGQLWR